MLSPNPPDSITLKILLADDHESFRNRVRKLLCNTPGLELVGDAVDGEEAVRLAAELKPDIVIMDIAMPRLNGIEATRQITHACPSTRVIALSLHDDSGFRRAMFDAGASTYLLKDDVGNDLPKILHSILAGTA